ncbi:MAG: hypothetical protein ACRDFB_04955 [Rhabdochlamydiaceae bacterium]
MNWVLRILYIVLIGANLPFAILDNSVINGAAVGFVLGMWFAIETNDHFKEKEHVY